MFQGETKPHLAEFMVPSTGVVMKADTSGVSTIASNQANPMGIALDANSIYWTNSTSGEIMKLAK